MAQEKNKVGAGDPRIDEDAQRGGANLPGTPGYESEAAYRHRESNLADEPEIRSTELMPGDLDEREAEPQVHFQTLKWNQDTKHHSK